MFGLTIVKRKNLEGLIIQNETLVEEKRVALEKLESLKASYEHCRSYASNLEAKLRKCISRPRGEKGRFTKTARV